MRRSASMLTAVVAVSLTLGGCAGPAQPEVTPPPEMPPVEDIVATPPAGTSDPSMGAQSFSYLEGLWTVTATGADAPAGAADPSGTWEFAVMGESVTVHVGERRYEGLIAEADGGWTYRGMVTGSNAQGEPLGGYIEIEATDTGEGVFTGTFLQAVDGDDTTSGYTARWTIAASAQ